VTGKQEQHAMNGDRCAARNWRDELTRDPRAATYWEDSAQWVWLKTRIFDDAHASDELLGGIDFIRCHGARIIGEVGGGHRIGRGECPGEIYREVRTTVLQANAVLIQRLLRSMPPPRWSISQTELSA
jgi:hypothetical protein